MQKEIEVLVNSFMNAYLHDAINQLKAQVASGKVAIARLSSSKLYYVLSGNDFSLDINDPIAQRLYALVITYRRYGHTWRCFFYMSACW